GEILIEGRDITGLSEQDLQPLRRRIVMIFQHFTLLSAKTVEENVALPLKIEGLAKSELLKRAHEQFKHDRCHNQAPPPGRTGPSGIVR
ncbi:ATP-binding cassette domain-containing protein, partial [Rhizobium ruizarguesonis]